MPSEFLRQTPKSFVICMEGMHRAATRSVDLSTHNAWHTAIFALSGYAGKLKGKSLSDFLSSRPKQEEPEQRSDLADAIQFFHSLKTRGVPVEITRTMH